MADLLNVGTRAPDFVLEGTHNKRINSADFRGKKHLVVAFYPKDNTSG